jgi:hypothetical protein
LVRGLRERGWGKGGEVIRVKEGGDRGELRRKEEEENVGRRVGGKR